MHLKEELTKIRALLEKHGHAFGPRQQDDEPIDVLKSTKDGFARLARRCEEKVQGPDGEVTIKQHLTSSGMQEHAKGQIRALNNVTGANGLFSASVRGRASQGRVLLAEQALYDPAIRDALSMTPKDLAGFVKKSVYRDKDGETRVVFDQYRTINGETLPLLYGFISVFTRRPAASDQKQKLQSSQMKVTKIRSSFRRGTPERNLHLAKTMEEAVEAAIADYASTGLVDVKVTSKKAFFSSYQKSEGTKKQRQRQWIGKVFRVELIGRDPKHGKMPLPASLLIEAKTLRVLSKKSLLFFMDTNATTLAYVGDPDPNKKLDDQLVRYEQTGVAPNTKALGDKETEVEYESQQTGVVSQVKPNSDGNYDNLSDADAEQASSNYENIRSQRAWYRRLSAIVFKYKLNMLLQDSGTQDNAYATIQADRYRMVGGVGSGGSSGLKKDLCNGRGVFGHEFGHVFVFAVSPDGDMPSEWHEALADKIMHHRMYQTRLENAGKNGEAVLTAQSIANDPRHVGSYAAGELTGANGDKGEIRNSRAVVSQNVDTSDPHLKGCAIARPGMDYTQQKAQRPSVALQQSLDDGAIAVFKSVSSSHGSKTTAEDFAHNYLVYDQEKFGGVDKQFIKDTYAKGDINAAEVRNVAELDKHYAEVLELRAKRLAAA